MTNYHKGRTKIFPDLYVIQKPFCSLVLKIMLMPLAGRLLTTSDVTSLLRDRFPLTLAATARATASAV